MRLSRSRTELLVFDRHLKTIFKEAIYGERWLRMVYGSSIGRVSSRVALGSAWFSVVCGAWMNTRFSARSIPSFVARYSIDMDDFEVPKDGWRSFNEFFSRRLRPGARPVDVGENVVVLPSDGRHSAYPDDADLSGLVVKGRPFTLEELFGGAEAARPFKGGALVVSRLCPTDYHRFHFPLSGIPSAARPIRGGYDSVSTVAIRAGARSLCENKRSITILHTQSCGDVALIEVGAACVGRIEQTFAPDVPVSKGDEKGFFLFGGSTVITVFRRGCVELAEDLVRQTAAGIETCARMGERMGTVRAL
jgi:phosphatidylserine decarboxylase